MSSVYENVGTALSDSEISMIADELAHAARYEVVSDGEYNHSDMYSFRQTVYGCRCVIADILHIHGWFNDPDFTENWVTAWSMGNWHMS